MRKREMREKEGIRTKAFQIVQIELVVEVVERHYELQK